MENFIFCAVIDCACGWAFFLKHRDSLCDDVMYQGYACLCINIKKFAYSVSTYMHS